MSKSDTIKETLKETRLRRKSQDCKVYEIKIDKSSLSNNTLEKINRLFLEAKWFYNYVLSQDDIFKFDTKIKNVIIKNKDNIFENRNINQLSSQMKQGIHDRILSSVKSLSTKKKKGNMSKVGKLKFKSFINSIPLKQFNVTYKIIDNKIQIQGIKKKIKVRGLKQIPINVEYTNANLIKRNGDYYIKITCFLPNESIPDNNNFIGIDFGIKTQLTFSNGVKLETKIPISNRTKKLHKKLSRSKKVNGLNSKTKNQFKIRELIKKSYEVNSNKKRDIKNKIIHKLRCDYSIIVIQNENIKGWHSGLFGRQIQESSIGGIISGIKQIPQTRIIDRFFPSTKLCPNCGILNKITLNERRYNCECGYSNDRDIHSACNILIEGLPTERREFKPMESNTAVEMYEYFKKIPYILCKCTLSEVGSQ